MENKLKIEFKKSLKFQIVKNNKLLELNLNILNKLYFVFKNNCEEFKP
jgi:hypothetical protein